MNKAFEKILKKIEEKRNKYQRLADNSNFDGWHEEDIEYSAKAEMCEELKEIVQEVAEEYNGGWIPCSERLPSDDDIYIVTVEYPNSETLVQYGWFDKNGVCWYVGMQEFRTSNVLAWMSLPQPYKESENKK